MLKIYLGPMYSGKTTELIRNYNRFKKYNQIIVDYDTSNIKDSNIDKSTLELEGNFKYYLDTLCNHNGQAISCFKIRKNYF